MSNLFLADKDGSFEDLFKAGITGGGPRTGSPGGGPRTGSGGGPRTGNPGGGPRTGTPRPAKVPGAASGASGVQSIDCPLGAACPDGGKHQMGSSRLQEHQQQAMAKQTTGETPGDESEGKASGKPGVEPGSQNMGSVGSDQVERTPAPVGQDAQNQTAEIQESEIHTELDEDEDGPTMGKKDLEYSAQAYEKDPHGAPTRSIMQGSVHDEPGGKSPPPLPKKDRVKEVGGAVPYVHKIRTGMDKQDVPNPIDPSTAPPDSKPMDHYRLAQVARQSGDEDLAKQHEELARKRSDQLGSEEHRELANELRRDGMNEHADYHDNIHARVQSMKGEESGETEDTKPSNPAKKEHYWARQRRREKETGIASPQRGQGGGKLVNAESNEEYAARRRKVKEKFEARKREESMRDVHAETKQKASSELEQAKKKHAETVAKMQELKDKNKQKQSEYEKAQAEYEKKKAAGDKKAKPPKKPKLEKEEEAPEKPELYEPESDAEKLQHETHTQRAKRVADNIESHLRDNDKLTPAQRRVLERAHKMAVYHSNVGYTPTAAHKKELGEIERAAGEHGKAHHDEVKAKEDQVKAKQDQQAVQRAAKQEQAERKQQEKAQAQQAKEQAKADKEQAKAQGELPKMPQSDLDHARMQDHKAKAQKIRANLESQAQNPNLPPEEREKHKRILKELEKHENIEHVPGGDHQSELKEIEKLAGESGKKAYTPGEETEEESVAPQNRPYDSGGSTVLAMLNAGRGLGQGLAASATSPYGAAGHIGSQIVNYGVTGAVTAGHRLLHDSESANKRADVAQAQFDAEKERQEKQANAASQVDGEKAKVTGRGNT